MELANYIERRLAELGIKNLVNSLTPLSTMINDGNLPLSQRRQLSKIHTGVLDQIDLLMTIKEL